MPSPLGFLVVCEQVFVRVKMKEEITNIGRLSALGVGCQPVHQLPNDTFPIYHLLLGVARSKVVTRIRVILLGFSGLKMSTKKANIILSLSSLQFFTK